MFDTRNILQIKWEHKCVNVSKMKKEFYLPRGQYHEPEQDLRNTR